MIGHPAFFTPSKGFSHTIGGILALAAMVFFFCFTQAAGVTVECLSPPRTLSPRSLSTLVFRITNLGPGTDMFQLEFVLPEGFAIVSAPTRMELGPGESKVLLVSLFASPTAPAGTYEISLRAVSESTPARFAEASATVTVLRKAAVELRLPAGRQGWPGGQVAYKLWVINRGNDVDSFRLEAWSGWRVELSQELLQLLPEEGAEVTLTLYIPEEAKPGDRDCSRVIVHSVSAPDVGDEGVITTVVSPPAPEGGQGDAVSHRPGGAPPHRGLVTWRLLFQGRLQPGRDDRRGAIPRPKRGARDPAWGVQVRKRGSEIQRKGLEHNGWRHILRSTCRVSANRKPRVPLHSIGFAICCQIISRCERDDLGTLLAGKPFP